MSKRYLQCETRPLWRILEDLGCGRIRLPILLSDPWPQDKQLDFLQSLKTEIPLGSITLFRTKNDFPYEKISDTRLDTYYENYVHYVLDGIQRMSCLSKYLLRSDKEEIYYDPIKDQFSLKEEEESYYPACDLLDSIALRRYQMKFGEPDSLDTLIQILRSCTIPVFTMYPENNVEISEIRMKINSRSHIDLLLPEVN
jgi:hypothetical protein